MLDRNHYGQATRSGSLEERNNACGEWLGGGKQIKAKGVSKGGWQTMKCDKKPGSVFWTCVTSCDRPNCPPQLPTIIPVAGVPERAG